MKNKKSEYEFDKFDLGVELRKLQGSLLITDLITAGVLFVLVMIGYHLI
jgi:hypothetical protein